MRSLLIPAGIVAFGLLAALPFRRSAELPAPRPEDAIGLPQTVTPLRESPLAEDLVPATVRPPFASAQFASTKLPTENPYAPPLGSLASSYQEVAVPLALPHDPGNLLDSALDLSDALQRFGIPRAPREGGAEASPPGLGESQWASTKGPAADFEGTAWQTERAIPTLDPASALASVLDAQPAPMSQFVSEPAAADSQGALADSGPTAPPSAKFQTVSQSKPAIAATQPSSPAVAAGLADLSNATESADVAEPRQRLFIREPR